jgi:hypothetical protein
MNRKEISMKIRWVFGAVVLCLAAGLAIAPGATTVAVSSAPMAVIGPAPVGSSVSGCFPIDECNICCPLSGGKIVCTERACV